jgi:hypothetical protein
MVNPKHSEYGNSNRQRNDHENDQIDDERNEPQPKAGIINPLRAWRGIGRRGSISRRPNCSRNATGGLPTIWAVRDTLSDIRATFGTKHSASSPAQENRERETTLVAASYATPFLWVNCYRRAP